MRVRSSTSIVLVLSAAGCQPGWDDHAELSSPRGCFLDCPRAMASFGDPIATGARAVLYVSNADRLPPFTVVSSDETVVTFTTTEATDEQAPHVLAVAHGAGSAVAIVRDPDGGVIDDQAFEVHDVARLALTPDREGDRLLLMTGGTLKIYVDMRDADDRPLFGYGGVSYTTSGSATLTSALDASLESDFVLPFLEQVIVSGDEPGGNTIEARTGEASFTFDVEIVDASAVASLELWRDFSFFGRLWAHASDVDGVEIHDPLCEWEFEPADLEYLITVDRSSLGVSDDPEAVGVVTCRIGDLRASLYVGP